MPTSAYMPDVKVEVAFNAGFTTPTASRTWTDVSTWVELGEGATITVGRQDERSTADANTFSLVLDNRDGRFTPGRSSSPYYPNVRLYRPVRVTATPVDGPAVVLFLGFISQWPVEWEGTDGYAKVTLTASSRLARLGLNSQLRSAIEETILANSPVAYYTLGEPEGATQANDSSGLSARPLVLAGFAGSPVIFGNATGPGTDGLTAAQFQDGQYLYGTTPSGLAGFECFFEFTGTTGVRHTLFDWDGGRLRGYIEDVTGRLRVFANSGATSLGATSGALSSGTHHLFVVVDSGAGTASTYLDGVSLGSSPVTLTPSASPVMGIGGGSSTAGFQFWPGVIAHVAWYTTVVSAGSITAHASAGLTGFLGELTSARLLRYAALAGIPATEVAAETGQTPMGDVDTTGKQVVELMRTVETTEGGVLFDAPDGTLTLHNRAHRYAAASAYTLNMGSGHVEADYASRYDAASLVNDATVSNTGGTVTARTVDPTSRGEYGEGAASVETASTDAFEPGMLAAWLVNTYKDPKERVPTLSVQVPAQVGKTPNSATVLATTVGTKVTVAGRPTQAATSSVDYFVEGWTLAIGQESMDVTFNVSPSAPYDGVFVLGDASRGVLDTSPLAY